MFDEYVKHCENKLINIGKLWVYNVPHSKTRILNFPTKFHWKFPSKAEYLEKGLSKFVETYKERGITSIAFPLLGAQNGGLNPEMVVDLMERYLSKVDIPVEIYQYEPSAEDDLIGNFKKYIFSTSPEDVEKQTGLKKAAIAKIRKALENEEIRGLVQLAKVKGIGEETVKTCFKFMMKYVPQPSLLDLDINNEQVSNEKYESEVLTKISITGLPEQIILNIENGVDEVSIKDLKIYCSKLNIDINNFFY